MSGRFTTIYWYFRVSGIRQSIAKSDVLTQFLGYSPPHLSGEELTEAMEWYVQHS